MGTGRRCCPLPRARPPLGWSRHQALRRSRCQCRQVPAARAQPGQSRQKRTPGHGWRRARAMPRAWRRPRALPPTRSGGCPVVGRESGGARGVGPTAGELRACWTASVWQARVCVLAIGCGRGRLPVAERWTERSLGDDPGRPTLALPPSASLRAMLCSSGDICAWGAQACRPRDRRTWWRRHGSCTAWRNNGCRCMTHR